MNTHSGFFSPSNLLSAAFLAAALFVAPSAKAAITINGTSYSSGKDLDTANATWTITGTASGYVNVKENCTITLDNVTWTASNTKQDLIRITAGKTVTLKLKGASTMSYNSKNYTTAIYCCSGTTLNITNITDDASLVVSMTGSYCTGIGGSFNGTGAAGTINIWGGAISSYGGSGGAGIGGYRAAGGTVNIYGGTIIAKGGASSSYNFASAGIGGGSGGTGGTINIYGGTVKATGATSGTYGSAGIGGGHGAAGGTVNICGGTVTATGGTRSAGIGGGYGKAGGTVKVYGGVVTATGGERAAGIGGGNGAAGGAFYNYGGTVWAKGAGTNTSYGDIGAGQNGSGSQTFLLSGGSTMLLTGYSVGMANPVNSDGSRVYRVAVTTPAANTDYTFSGLETYGQTTLRSNSSSLLHLWLPNGSYEFSDEDYIYTATVNGAKTTATRTAKPTTTTVTFKDWNGTTIDEYTDDIGAALTAPANPSRAGYTFTGWSPEVPSAFPEKDTTYTAQYTANQYTLTFYDEDGTTVLDTITQDCDSAVTAPSPAKAEYIFSGWSPDVPATMPPGNLSFTAKWELAPYFRLVSVTPGTDGKVTVKYNSYNTDLTKGDFTLTVKDTNGAVAATVTEWETAPSTEAGEQTAVWNAKDFIAALANPADYTFTLSVGAEAEAKYLVIDLSNGSKTYIADVPEGGWTDEYKTTKLVLRRILGEGETATFTMGSPTTEAGRTDNETQHSVTLTKPYWMGVFEFTQGQWAAVKGSSPSCTFSGATRPVETVAWADLKGAITSYGETSATGSSFFGTLRSLVGSESGLNLPTEAEWEYACRAGTTSAFNDGSELTASDTQKSSALDAIAVYDNNSGDTTAVVGTKAPNAWGLYDMHGNVREWCHDQSVERTTDATDLGSAAATDPVASSVSSASNPYRVTRGGSWYNYANGCRSARRTARFQENGTATVSGESYTGFRVAAREFVGEAKVGSQIDAENTVSATLGKKPRKGFVMMVY